MAGLELHEYRQWAAKCSVSRTSLTEALVSWTSYEWNQNLSSTSQRVCAISQAHHFRSRSCRRSESSRRGPAPRSRMEGEAPVSEMEIGSVRAEGTEIARAGEWEGEEEDSDGAKA
eukprot:6209125-Pleurochrysis_carterae.AAC.1